MARVLVIEDNLANSELMRFLLAAYGHTPVVSRNGEEGLAEALRERPDLIICDIQMPGLDGYGVLARLKADERLRRVPCVAVTAFAMRGDRESLLAAGFDGYLSKPIEPETFVPQVQGFLKSAAPSFPGAAFTPAQHGAGPPGITPFATVLVVDDVANNRDLILQTLAPHGYAVTLAENISTALGLARTRPPDLIISDLEMPGGDGFAFLKAVKADAALARIPFLILGSSERPAGDSRRARELGATAYLQRPVEPPELLRSVRAILPLGPLS
jgi:two-component system cell cycle response regulator